MIAVGVGAGGAEAFERGLLVGREDDDDEPVADAERGDEFADPIGPLIALSLERGDASPPETFAEEVVDLCRGLALPVLSFLLPRW